MSPLPAPCRPPAKKRTDLRTLAGILCLAVAVACAASLARADNQSPNERPQRIVSLNLCTDELLMRLADPAQITSISWLARDPVLGNLADQAAAFTTNRGMAEEIMGLEPDLILAGRYTTTHTVALLRRLGFRVIDFDFPSSINETAALIRRFGETIGQTERAQRLADEMLAEFARLEPLAPDAERPTALIYQPNGFTAGAGSLMDNLLTASGLLNVAAHNNRSGYGPLPLELVVKTSPDILVLDRDSTAPALAQQFLNHRVLAAMPDPPVSLEIPSRLWTCAGPAMVEAVKLLRAARDRVTGQGGHLQ